MRPHWILALLTLLGLSSCGLKFDSEQTARPPTPCSFNTKSFPSSERWSSELLNSVILCSSDQANLSDETKLNSLKETALWLNQSFDTQTKQELTTFLDSIPPELGDMLGSFARSSQPTEQKHWPEWVRWTLTILEQKTLRNEILSEQLLILSQVPSDSLLALTAFLEKLRIMPQEKRLQVLERLAKLFTDFERDQNLQTFLTLGVTPLTCLKLEAENTDTSLISSGWSLLIRSKDDPLLFGKTFLQSYGLLQNFCNKHEIPSPAQTQTAMTYYFKNQSELFLPILKNTDTSSRALIPLLKLWSESKLSFTQTEFFDLIDGLSRVLIMAHKSDPEALSSYVQMLANWAKEKQSSQEILKDISNFKNIPWNLLKIPEKVLSEWSLSAEAHKTTFLQVLSDYLKQNSHLKLSQLLKAVKLNKTPQNPSKIDSPIFAPNSPSIKSRLESFAVSSTERPLPKNSGFLKCFNTPNSLELWTCLAKMNEPIPFSQKFLENEKKHNRFFNMTDPEQPGRWLGQGFFGPSALPRWTSALQKLDGFELPIRSFVSSFPMQTLESDDQIKQTYLWFKSTPQTQPETISIRNELGIPQRLSINDFNDKTWLKWFSDPSKWLPVKKVLSDPSRSHSILIGLKKLSQKKLKVKLYRSDASGVNLTSQSTIGMLSALDILLWEVPYDSVRKWIIKKILSAKSPSDLRAVLIDSQNLLEKGYKLLDSNFITQHGKLWKKAANSLAILNTTISLNIENELYDWCELMKALSSGLSTNNSTEFLVTLHKTGIISSISHFLHEKNPSPQHFASTLIEVFHLIRNSSAGIHSWFNAASENQVTHGLFVYQVFAMASESLQHPSRFYHLKQMTSIVRTGVSWIESQKLRLPLSNVFETISGPETVLNPWIWVFLREVQDHRAAYHEAWMNLLGSLEPSSSRSDVNKWIESGIPANIGSWMDAIILTPSNRF